MTDRWEQINRIWDAALEVPEAQRPTFLQEACHGDEELRREVESLLSYDTRAKQFIDHPALQVTAEKLAAEPPSLVGRKLGPYQILGVLGAGGMGEVYRARDTRLNRTVAIKVLPRHLSERADLRQRFEREARAIASLDHPHICALYDIGHEGTTDFLVMQYLEGETLSQRLKGGPLPTEDVVRYSIEIAGALDTAHRKGVIHRDLKPGNIMLTGTGAKLLDFGLAKRQTPVLRTGATNVEVALRATSGLGTQSESLTEEGMILGTLEYMAPEQLEGKEADARTDIFALGVVIYEMATGRKAFGGDSKASVIAKILTAQPPLMTTVEPVTPPELDSVVQRCLAKTPEERWQSAAELTSELQEIRETVLPKLKARTREKDPGAGAKEVESEPKAAASKVIAEQPKLVSRLIPLRALKVSLAGIVIALIVGSVAVWRRQQQPQASQREMLLKPITSYSTENPVESAAISPDGKYLAFCSNGKLFIQIMRTGEKRSLALPEGFHAATVVWFPDSTKLLVSRAESRWTTEEGQATLLPDRSLWSLSILGGTPQKIVDHAEFPAGIPAGDGSSVSPDGSLVAYHIFNADRGRVELWVVGANGEGPRRVRAPSQKDDGYFGPIWSPTGKRLFYIRDNSSARWIESCDLNGEHVTKIFPLKDGQKYFHGWDVLHSLCWVPDGRILFSMQEKAMPEKGGPFNLWEIKVDAATGQALGEVRRFTQWSGFQTVYADSLSITADGKQLVVLKGNLQVDVYMAESGAGGKSMKSPHRLTSNETDDEVWGWTPDSRSVLFSSNRNGDNIEIFRQDISQTDAETITTSPENNVRPNLSPDGAFLLYLASKKTNPTTTRLVRVPVGGGPPESVLSGEGIMNFSCAREANLCVVVEEMQGKQILTTFDPLKGRGEQLPTSDYPRFGMGILSPQGRIVEKLKSGPDGLQVRVRSLPKGPAEEVTFKDLTSAYQFGGWSLDGKGVYLYTGAPLRGTCIYAGLNGETHVFWKRGSGPGFWFGYPIPSPDGQQFAFTLGTYESNAWMLENF